MTDNRDELAGQILRVWREHAGQTGTDVARAMGFVPSAVTNWEKGDRGRRRSEFLRIVKEYATTGLGLDQHETEALTGMWQAANSPHVVPARVDWSHNYEREADEGTSPVDETPSGPVWAWVRQRRDAAPVNATVRWDPFQTRLDLPASTNGVIIQVPTSVPNPPLTIRLREPGWVDFGLGQVPERIAQTLGIAYVRARTFIGPAVPWIESAFLAAPDHRELFPLINEGTRLAGRLGLWWIRGSPRHALDGGEIESTTWPGATLMDERGALVSQMLVSPSQAQDIREARGLSRRAASDRITKWDPDSPIGVKIIEGIEGAGRIPKQPRVLTRLDMLYHMDGRFGVDRTYDSRWARIDEGFHRIRFPRYWRGPVWVQVHSADQLSTCTVELTWGPWRRRQRMTSGGVLTTRKATAVTPPMRVRVPAGWGVLAGVGAIPTALDVNDGWYPHSIPGAIKAIGEALQAVRRGLSAEKAEK